MPTENKTESRQSLRSQKYWLIVAFVSGSFIAISLWSGSWPTWKTFQSLFLTIGISGLVASVIPFLQTYTLERNLTESISTSVKDTINESKRKIDAIQSKIYPKTLYIGDNEDELFNNAIDKCLHKATHFKFMSISAEYLLKNRLMKFQPKGTIDIQLLLQNPNDISNLTHRHDQLKHFEKKDINRLRVEIIKSVIRSYCLVRIYDSYNLQIRFHNEFPVCRLEFSGENDLFISYYKSQFGEKNWGPVAHYKKENDIFNSYNYFFSKMWNNYKKLQIDLSQDHDSPNDLIKYIETIIDRIDLPSELVTNSIKQTLNAFCENGLNEFPIIKNWLKDTNIETEKSDGNEQAQQEAQLDPQKQGSNRGQVKQVK